MPIFEYRCLACSADFEYFVRKPTGPPACPSCGADDVEKLMSTPSVSSDQTRRRSVTDIRTRNRAVRRDHAHEEVKRIESHARDHDD
jgi:putative FmdB family regulatory protein